MEDNVDRGWTTLTSWGHQPLQSVHNLWLYQTPLLVPGLEVRVWKLQSTHMGITNDLSAMSPLLIGHSNLVCINANFGIDMLTLDAHGLTQAQHTVTTR